MQIQRVILSFFVLHLAFAQLKQYAPNGLNKELLSRLGRFYRYVLRHNHEFIEKQVHNIYKYDLMGQFINSKFYEYYSLLGLLSNPERERKLAKPYNKQQDTIPDSRPFPCNVTGGRSEEIPTSVHRVRPGDIDLIAQFGDSVAHANGVLSQNSMGFTISDHDIAMFIGGRDTWRKYFTLPNILKEFNPGLKGYARNFATLNKEEKGHYDFAAVGTSVEDIVRRAKEFIAKAKADPRVDFENDWKLVTIYLGGIDSCHQLCVFRDLENGIARHKEVIERGLDYLMENSPRTIVNFIPVPNFARLALAQKDVPAVCQIIQRVICHCIFAAYYDKEKEYFNALEKISKGQFEVASNPKYQQKDDFAVLTQYITRDWTMPMLNEYSSDFRYWATDCTHISQRTQAAVAVGAWNSLITPFGQKPFSFEVEKPLEFMKCPTAEKPYIATPQNSKE